MVEPGCKQRITCLYRYQMLSCYLCFHRNNTVGSECRTMSAWTHLLSLNTFFETWSPPGHGSFIYTGNSAFPTMPGVWPMRLYKRDPAQSFTLLLYCKPTFARYGDWPWSGRVVGVVPCSYFTENIGKVSKQAEILQAFVYESRFFLLQLRADGIALSGIAVSIVLGRLRWNCRDGAHRIIKTFIKTTNSDRFRLLWDKTRIGFTIENRGSYQAGIPVYAIVSLIIIERERCNLPEFRTGNSTTTRNPDTMLCIGRKCELKEGKRSHFSVSTTTRCADLFFCCQNCLEIFHSHPQTIFFFLPELIISIAYIPWMQIHQNIYHHYVNSSQHKSIDSYIISREDLVKWQECLWFSNPENDAGSTGNAAAKSRIRINVDPPALKVCFWLFNVKGTDKPPFHQNCNPSGH